MCFRLFIIMLAVVVSIVLPTVAYAHSGTLFRAVVGFIPTVMPAILTFMGSLFSMLRKKHW